MGEGKCPQMREDLERREDFKKSKSMRGGGSEMRRVTEDRKDSEKGEGIRGGRMLRKGELS